MLSFTLNTEPLVLSHDTSVQLVWQNPACNFKSFPGDVGLGIDIPVNDHNRMLMGNPERFDRYATENKRELPNFEITYSGVLLMRGTLVIENAGNETYSGWLRSEAGNIGKTHREKYIYDSISFNEEKTFVNKSNYDPDSDEYTCPEIRNPMFFEEKGEKHETLRLVPNPTFGKTIRKYFWDIQIGWETDDREFISVPVDTEDLTEAFLLNGNWRVNRLNPGFDVYAPDTTSKADPDSIVKDLKVAVVSPMLFLNYVLKALFKDASFSIRNNFLAGDDDLKNLIIYHNFDITNMEYTTNKVEAFIQTYDERFNDPLGLVESLQMKNVGYTVSDVRRWVDKFVYKNLLPKIRLNDFVMSIQNELNVFFHFVPGQKIVDIIDREGILDGEAIDIEKYLTGFWEIGEKKNNTLKFSFEHDSNDLIITERWEDISDYRDKEKEPVETWDALQALPNPDTDEIRFVREANGYAQYKLWLLEDEDEDGALVQKKFIGWGMLSIAFQIAYFNYRKNEREEEEIKTEFSTLVDEGRAGTRQKGNIRSELFAYETFSPRLLFAKPYNQADYETANISLDWEKEETGLLETRWKYWKRIWATRQEVNTEAHFHLGILEYVIHNIYKKFRGQEGEFLIDEMKTEFRMNEIGKTQIKGYKFDYAPKTYTLDDMWQLNDIIFIDETIDLETNINFYL